MNPETLETQDKRMTNALLGLAGEVGEMCDLWKKFKGHGHEFDREKFKKEISDVLFYTAESASAINATLEEIAHTNVNKLSKRYPTGRFTVQDSIEKKDQVGVLDGTMEYKVLDVNTPIVRSASGLAEELRDNWLSQFDGDNSRKSADDYDDLCYARELRERAENPAGE